MASVPAAAGAGAGKPVFWKPGTSRPAELPSVDREPHREGASVVYNANASLSLAQQRRRLPIFDERRALLWMVEQYATLVVVGHTGCGKTTQIPQYLHEAGWTADGFMVACTQPRRVAATSVATRVAEEMGVSVGGVVGYAVRFDDAFDPNATRIKYMTDGRLIREMMSDPLLSQYSAVMVDEAHERSALTDILLGLLKKVRRKRPELRLIVSSATLDAEEFADFFEEHVGVDGSECERSAAVLTLRGAGVHPVTWKFLEAPVADYLAHAVEAVLQIHASSSEGDILLFLTGQQEVDAACSMLQERANSAPTPQHQRRRRDSGSRAQAGGGGGGAYDRLSALPIYSGLSSKAQLRVFEPPPRGTRKVVVATNIAETSLTIDGIVHVVDCGFAKLRFSNPSGEEALVISPISQASARQRAGRAGRSRPGCYYSLMTEATFDGLSPQTAPEMCRCALAPVVLQLKALGVDNVLRFDFLSPPPPSALAHALETLYALGALDGSGKLTAPRGETMALLPLDPQPAAFLLSASPYGCETDALTLAALLSVRSPFTPLKPADLAVARAPFAVYEGDAVTLLNVYHSYLRKVKRSGERQASSWCRKHLLDERVLTRAGQVRRQLTKHLAAHAKRAAEAAKLAGAKVEEAKADASGGTTGTDALRRALVRGYFASAARHDGGGHYTSILHGSPIKLHPSCVLYGAPPDWIVVHESTHAAVELVLSATKVDEAWLVELAPHFYAREDAPNARGGVAQTTMGDAAGAGKAPHVRGVKHGREADEARGAAGSAEAEGGGVAALLGDSLFKGRRFF